MHSHLTLIIPSYFYIKNKARWYLFVFLWSGIKLWNTFSQQVKRVYLYSDLYFGVNWAPLKDLTVFAWPQIGCFSWRSFGRPLAVALFPIKKPFYRGSSGSHASKYIHFHRKCFVLEVQCFLGLLCSHSTQVGFLSDVCWTPTPPPHRCIYPTMENTNKTRVLLIFLQPSKDLSSAKDLHRKRQNKGAVHYSVEKRSVRACACVFASLHMLHANKQDTGKHKPTGKPAIKVKLCGKHMTDVYSLAQSWNATSLLCVLTAVSLCLCPCFLSFCVFSQVFKSWCKNLGRRRWAMDQPVKMGERAWRAGPGRDDPRAPRRRWRWLQLTCCISSSTR